MKATDVFPSKYLRAADLDGHEPIVTVDHVEVETLGDERKPVVYFVGKEKCLVLNKTNFSAITDISGQDDTDNWRGVKVKLITARVEYQGKRVPAIRIEEPTAPRRPAPPVEQIDDDQIPF